MYHDIITIDGKRFHLFIDRAIIDELQAEGLAAAEVLLKDEFRMVSIIAALE